MRDVIVIGSGIIGSNIARELSKYDLKITIVDKENDVCKGASKANSAIVHGGHDPESNTLVAKLNVEGNEMFEELCKDLSVPFKRNGALVVGFNDDDKKTLNELLNRSIKNGVKGARIINSEEVYKKEPNLTAGIVSALFVPSSGIVGVYELTIALCENAIVNGVQFKNNFCVKEINKDGDVFTVESENGDKIKSKIVINASGIEGQKTSELICEEEFDIKGYKGEYYLLDKENLVTSTIFKCPSKHGKGVLITPTVHGNIIVGPNNNFVENGEDRTVSKDGLEDISKKALETVDKLDFRNNIRNFAGVRAKVGTNEFIIGENKKIESFYNVVGIASPGLTASPAISNMVREWVVEKMGCKIKKDFINKREQTYFHELSIEEKNELIEKDKSYGQIVCRCEGITEGEILESIRRPLGAVTIEGVKRRCRAGAGRCQGGFCQTRVLELLKNEKGLSSKEVVLDNNGSNILV